MRNMRNVFFGFLRLWSSGACFTISGIIFYDGRDYDLRQIWYVPTKAHLWYLYAMIPIYLVLPFFQILCRNMTMKLEKAFVILISAAVLINYLAGVAGGQLYYDIPIVGDRVYFFYVLIGYYLFKYRKHIRVSQTMAVLISIISLLITFGSSVWFTLSGNAHSDRMLAYSTPFMILTSVFFFLFMIRLSRSKYTPSEKARRVIDAFGKASFGIYLIHIFFLGHLQEICARFSGSGMDCCPGTDCGDRRTVLRMHLAAA